MIKKLKIHCIVMALCFFAPPLIAQTKIDRKAVVERHQVQNTSMDTLSSLTVGNGQFAYTVDATGMQSFPRYYQKGVSLGTQSEWGWNTFPNTGHYKFEETLKAYDFNKDGRNALYSIQNKEGRAKEATEYYRINPHRIQLGNVGLQITLKNGKTAVVDDIKQIKQILNPWTGIIESHFTVEGTPVTVLTAGDSKFDQVAVQVKSTLVRQGRIKVFVRYPFPTSSFLDEATYYEHPEKHQSSIIAQDETSAVLSHKLSSIEYFTRLNYTDGKISSAAKHEFHYQPSGKSDQFDFTFTFSKNKATENEAKLYQQVASRSKESWLTFWQSGAAVDFEGSTDPRAQELERRVVLSQYLTKVQCTGDNPPQETGLTFNSWYGKPHTEMHWWHSVHFGLWGRPEYLEKSLGYYFNTLEKARALAQRQGYKGVRWIKMTDHEGNESPSSVAAFLIWQQPHLIYLAEMAYRHKQDPEIIKKYSNLVFETATFMADFAEYDKANDRYNLGLGVIPSQEVFRAAETRNPNYELAYWDWGLRIAQEWKKRSGQPIDKDWQKVIDKLAKLPQQDQIYLATETATDSYTNPKWRTDHPTVLAALGMVPESPKLDKQILKNTLDTVWKTWFWDETWGWDFPMVAMSAARLKLPNKALDALFMNIQTNTYLKNGHNYQDGRLRIYLPGNGGVLAAVAMMVAGWDGEEQEFPGFPNDGTWKIKAEGFKKMP
ncbi:hypothetical protein [Sphingobacterium sp. BN32]|uniref:hypothetical protein n=1 Tax=Sphingobacterium sp. BN32 TaxID=3058432 RepID=UPI00265D4692|nr:hypothetical protein [Sphingobacterium sp. BN32]WKK59489.1 hypothetical protein QYC40_04480 [Sphingobacterium sp. BN32]